MRAVNNMKSLFLLISLLIAQFDLVAQKSVTENEKSLPRHIILSISMFNHAEMNVVMIYEILGDQIEVSQRSFFNRLKKVIYSIQLSESALTNIKTSLKKLDTLKIFYMNWCIMPTSGEEFSIRYETDLVSRIIKLHSYYLKQIKDLMDIINVYLPKRYRMRYLSEKETQDCDIKDFLRASEDSCKLISDQISMMPTK